MSFSGADNLLSTEFVPSLNERLGAKDNRGISHYYHRDGCVRKIYLSALKTVLKHLKT